MRRTYLLANKDLDRIFGFETELELSLPRTPQEGIRSSIDLIFSREKHDLVIGKVFVVDRIKGNGLAGIVDLNTKKRLTTDEVNPFRNYNIRLKGHYLGELGKYLSNDMSIYDKIVVVRSEVAPWIQTVMEQRIPEWSLRTAINDKPTAQSAYFSR